MTIKRPTTSKESDENLGIKKKKKTNQEFQHKSCPSYEKDQKSTPRPISWKTKQEKNKNIHKSIRLIVWL